MKHDVVEVYAQDNTVIPAQQACSSDAALQVWPLVYRGPKNVQCRHRKLMTQNNTEDYNQDQVLPRLKTRTTPAAFCEIIKKLDDWQMEAVR